MTTEEIYKMLQESIEKIRTSHDTEEIYHHLEIAVNRLGVLVTNRIRQVKTEVDNG